MTSTGALARFRFHRMRAYYLPFAAGTVLAASAFLPSVMLGEVGFGGVPSMSALWILGLGVAAMVLAALSVVTRKNSRHPLLLVGLLALGIESLAWQWLQRSVAAQAWANAEAAAIVEGRRAVAPAATTAGAGLYVGVMAAAVIVGFGLTIVVRRVSTLYAPPDDDV